MEELVKGLEKWNINISFEQIEKFEKYYSLLIEWNERMNLTSIIDKKEVQCKHFLDSLALIKYMDIREKKIIDVGTGAGFPGIPLKIMCEDTEIVLLDSLAKRLNFLNAIISELGLRGISTVHGRAEDLAHDKAFREKFDISTSRAVANLSTLSEYCLPFVKINGTFIAYKSGSVDEEITNSEKAIRIMGGKLFGVEKFSLPDSEYDRSLVFINKEKASPKSYPRKAGVPSKTPII